MRADLSPSHSPIIKTLIPQVHCQCSGVGEAQKIDLGYKREGELTPAGNWAARMQIAAQVRSDLKQHSEIQKSR
jgi:hypothetical protein